ncbi:MAG: hypothetical protein QMD08_00745 [Actinomycetota bacterium]|nr:hypothetical protein [Actinomycetota bacterium]
MIVRYHDIEIEFDVTPILITAASHVNLFRKRDPLARLKGPITLVSSNLYALQEGTEVPTPGGVLRAAPLLKPRSDGSAVLIHSGYPVTGTWDAIGQVELGHTLGSLRKTFTVSYDSDPNFSFENNLICFGSPSSNMISGQIFGRLEPIINDHFRWGEGYNAFVLNEQQFASGNEGVVVCHESPWDAKKTVLVLSGIGPMGTLGCSKLVSKWGKNVISRRQRKAKFFIAAIRYDIQADVEQQGLLKKFVILD